MGDGQQLNVLIDEEIYRRFKHKTIDHGMTQRACIEMLLEMYADGYFDEMLDDDLKPKKHAKRKPPHRKRG